MLRKYAVYEFGDYHLFLTPWGVLGLFFFPPREGLFAPLRDNFFSVRDVM